MSRSPNIRRINLDCPLFCLEGGGTHSRGALYLPSQEEPVATASSGICNPSNNFDAALKSARHIWAQLEESSKVDISSAVALLGVAGLNPKEVRSRFVKALEGFASVEPFSDGYAALVGCGGGRPCGMIVAGTGCAGHRLRTDGTSLQRDGWGWVGGDRGSGAWIGLRAIRLALKARDGLAEGDQMTESVIDVLGGDDSSITRWLGKTEPQEVASLAKLVFDSADKGVVSANNILDAAAASLRDLFASLGCAPDESLYMSGTIAEALADRISMGMETKPKVTPGMALEGLRLIASGKAPLEWPT